MKSMVKFAFISFWVVAGSLSIPLVYKWFSWTADLYGAKASAGVMVVACVSTIAWYIVSAVVPCMTMEEGAGNGEFSLVDMAVFGSFFGAFPYAVAGFETFSQNVAGVDVPIGVSVVACAAVYVVVCILMYAAVDEATNSHRIGDYGDTVHSLMVCIFRNWWKGITAKEGKGESNQDSD